MNNRQNANKFQRGKSTSPKRKYDELVVKNGLAITPARALQMAAGGVPVTGQNVQNFLPVGDTRPDWNVPLERTRGVDPADLWQTSRDIKSKVINAHRKDVEKYGE